MNVYRKSHVNSLVLCTFVVGQNLMYNCSCALHSSTISDLYRLVDFFSKYLPANTITLHHTELYKLLNIFLIETKEKHCRDYLPLK